LTGYDLLDYAELWKDHKELLKTAWEAIDLIERINKEYIETFNLAKAVNDRCNRLLERNIELLDRYERLNKNETVD
jgi:hypothetical protein